ncbi:MAG: hypothetical protein QXX08_06365 [Candidatus Bathyarchaeia archaeon]
MGEILEFCELCDAPLDADNCYGEKDFPLCRYHHEMLGRTFAFLVEISGNDKKPRQLLLLPEEEYK